MKLFAIASDKSVKSQRKANEKARKKLKKEQAKDRKRWMGGTLRRTFK